MKVMFAAVGSEIISLEALSAMLKKHGYECALAFERGMFDDKQYFTIPFLARIFNDRKQVTRDILEYKPDLLAFSVFADNFQWCLDIAKKVKKNLDVSVIMGGIHPTCVPEVCINEECVDIVCRGEGEYPLLELVESMHKGHIDYSISNLWFKHNGQIIKNPPRPLIENLDELPMIDKELFQDFIPISKYYLTVTNKGCIARCSYCSQNFYARWEKENNLGRFLRERSVDNVIKELKIMKQRYNLKRVDIKNNILSASKEWVLEFAGRYKNEINIPYRIMGHPKTITLEIAKALKDSGCWHVQIGIESINPQVRKEVLNRHESNEDIHQALDAMDEVGLKYSVDIMVGLPGETDEDIIEAIKFFSGRKSLIRASIFWLEYLPSVDITRFSLSKNIINDFDIETINKGLQANYLSTGSIRDLQKKERLLNYQILFRALPIVPSPVLNYILRRKRYRYFKYFPQIPIIIIIDILVSIIKKDHWATYAIYSYFWEIIRRIKRFFKSKNKVGLELAKKDLVKEFNNIFYEVEAESYDARHIEVIEGNKEWWNAVSRKYIRPGYNTDKIKVLDIGCGTGFVGEIVTGHLNKSDHFICYDLSPAMLEKSRQKLGALSNCNLHYINGDVDFLPFSANSMDVIIMSALLHHLGDCSALFSETDRLLKKDGLVIMAHEPNKLYFSSFVRRLAASIYKFLGFGKSITDQMQAQINEKLKERGIVKKELSKEEILKMVEYQSPVEQARITVKKDKGFLPREIINTYFVKYKLIESRQYSTYFIRPLFKKIPLFGFFVKNIASFLLGEGNLFSLILQK